MNNSKQASQSEDKSSANLNKPSLTSLIVGALLLGITLGVFLGEITSPLKFIGDVYVGLLQMTVLPYIVVSLIASIGRLSVEEGKILAKIGLLVLLSLWGLGGIVVVVMSFALPPLEAGAFFSTSLIKTPEQINHLDVYIPSNPFRSLASNYVPAVVLFCGLFGIAVIKVRGKEVLLSQFEVASVALRRINGFIIKLTPIGILAISASAAGTLTLEEFGRLQGYLLTFSASALLVALWMLPMTIAAFTPFRYFEVLKVSKDAVLTAFVTGSVFVVIPLMIEAVSRLFDERNMSPSDGFPKSEFVIPLGYSFPDVGKIVSLIFIPFAAWFYGSTIALGDYPSMLLSGLLLAFGKLTIALPFLLESQGLPRDIFQLFLLSGVVAGRFSDVTAAMHIMTFTILTSCGMAGVLKLRGKQFGVVLAGSFLIIIGLITGIRGRLEYTFEGAFRKDQVLAEMQLLQNPADVSMVAEAVPNPVAREPGESRLDRIRRRGTIRVGYQPDRVPFSYFNQNGELVGFDVDLIHRLAFSLGVSIEFVPYRLNTVKAQFEDDHFDIVISGVAGNLELVEHMLVTEPYLTVHLGVIVPNGQKQAFNSFALIRRQGPLRIGVLRDGYFRDEFETLDLNNVEFVELDYERDFFTGKAKQLDALVTSAEGGSAWTLLYPRYEFVIPQGRSTGTPLVFLTGSREDFLFKEYLDHWILLRRLDETIDRTFKYWIQGSTTATDERRWSVIRDVLGWIE